MGHSTVEVTSIYTDGACSGNPGPGGWGAIAYLSNGQVHEIGGAAKGTTNNRMELQAAIEILEWFKASPQTTPPTLYTDSKYVQDGITKWIKGWKKKQWKTSAGKPVLNQDLWQRLDAANQAANAQLKQPLRWEYVKGHAGHAGNERCDAIARGFAQGRPPSLSTVSPWGHSSEANGTDHPGQPTTTTDAHNSPKVQPSDSEHREDTLTTNGLANGGQNGQTNGKREQQGDRAPTTIPSPTSSPLTPDDQTMNRTNDGIGSDPDTSPAMATNDTPPTTQQWLAHLPQTALHQMIERLRVADELATHGYWITTAELALVVDLSPNTINSKGDRWLWRNWSIVRVNQESNPILWQLSRID